MKSTKKMVNQSIRSGNWDEAFDPLMENVLERFMKSMDPECAELVSLDIYGLYEEDFDGPAELFDFIMHDDYWSRKFTYHLIKELICQTYGVWE